LRKLEKLKNEGLLTEEEYKVRKEKLIDALLQEGKYAYYKSSIEKKQPRKSRIYIAIIILIILIVCSLIFLWNLLLPRGTSPTTYNYTYFGHLTPTSRIIYSGSITLEKDCSMKGWSIQANKGDIISVYWESNDYSTYVAIGSDADRERNRQYYCEVLIPFWRTSWPAADYGYSGSLEFRVPSSGTWHVIIANGNWECIFSECPITVTRLEIIHTPS